MATCVTWKQPDANHFNGFCTNKFRLTTPPYGASVDNGCEVCVNPTFPQWGCDDLDIISTQRSCGMVTGSTKIDTWRPMFILHSEADSDVFPWVFEDPFQTRPDAYYGDFALKSNSKCGKWVSDEPSIGVALSQRFELSFIYTSFTSYFLLVIYYRFGSVDRHVAMSTAKRPIFTTDCQSRFVFTMVKFDGDSFEAMPSSGNFYIE